VLKTEGGYFMMISAEAVTMKYRNGRGIENISLSVARGEIHVLLGSNGAGKSTLMRLLAGLAYPDSGVIRYRNQKEHTEVTDRLRTGGFLIEQPAPYDYLTARENLMQKGRYYLNGAESVNRALKLTGLEAHSEEKPKAFPPG
jgi:ABC-2 type transport system ATP-binding protein